MLACAENKDGQISKQEFLIYILGEESINSKGEFTDLSREQELRNQMRMLGAAARQIGCLFEVLDEDGSGFLNKSEARVFLQLAGCSESELELDYYLADLLRAADDNGDGEISKDEFVSYLIGEEELDERGFFVSEERELELDHQIRTGGRAARCVACFCHFSCSQLG